MLEYRHRLADTRIIADAVLLTTRVFDPMWYRLCDSVGVQLLAGDEEDSWRLV